MFVLSVLRFLWINIIIIIKIKLYFRVFMIFIDVVCYFKKKKNYVDSFV